MSLTVDLKQRESKELTLTILDGGVAANLAGSTLSFIVKTDYTSTETLITKADGDIDKDNASVGIITIPLSAADTNLEPGSYIGELGVTFSDAQVDYSDDIRLVVKGSLHP